MIFLLIAKFAHKKTTQTKTCLGGLIALISDENYFLKTPTKESEWLYHSSGCDSQ